MSSGERPIGATKGKQPITEALCQPPPPPPRGPLSKGVQTQLGPEEGGLPSTNQRNCAWT